MSSTIYNHRTLQPQGPHPPIPPQAPVHSPARLNESLDIVRQEFDIVTQDLNHLRTQRDDFENKISAQVNELNIIKQTLYELESQHSKVRQQYEDEVNRLRNELTQAQARQAVAVPPQGIPPHPGAVGGGPPGGPGIGGAGPPPPAGPPGSGPGPGIGGPGVGASPHPAHAGMAPPPAYNEPYAYRDRDRGEPPRDRGREDPREREQGMREREMRDRERELRDREAREARDRERELLREREAARERDNRERERDARERDARDAKRIKTERVKGDRMEYTPSQTFKYPEPGPSSSSIALGALSSTLPPSVAGPAGTRPPSPSGEVESFYDNLDMATLPAELKKEGSDWFAIFNPKVKRVLDVSLMHTLTHESVVCCVRFSADGKYLATGCNRTAQIYDTKTGAKTCILYDDSAPAQGDLYIRSVCFSPDGKLLATGAEDKQIRIWDIAKKRIRRVFEGHTQEIYSLDFSKDSRLIVSGSGDRTARVWDMETGSQKVLEINEPEGVDTGVTSVSISSDGRFVAAGSLDTIIRVWDVATGYLVERLQGHLDSVYSVTFTPDGKGIVSGSLDKTLKHWDITPILRSGGRKEPLPPVAPSSPVSATRAGLTQIMKPGVEGMFEGGERGGSCTLNFEGHKDYVLSVAVSHDGQWIVSGSKDRRVQFWEARSAEAQLMLQGHKNSVISIDLSPTGGLLATGSGDWAARLWSYTTI